jgi:hypothetical protein
MPSWPRLFLATTLHLSENTERYIYIYQGGIVTLNIKDPEAHRLAQTIAQRTGETMTHAVKEAWAIIHARTARMSNA